MASGNVKTKRNEELLKLGSRMPDGTVFAGISPDTKKPIYAEPEDFPIQLMWEQAVQYAAEIPIRGHAKGTFRVPTKSELSLLFDNRADIGVAGFVNEWHWASSDGKGETNSIWNNPERAAWRHNFEMRTEEYDRPYFSLDPKNYLAYVRFIRD